MHTCTEYFTSVKARLQHDLFTAAKQTSTSLAVCDTTPVED